jgi:outer membrane protein OmpA-like peptidoglycan-associated protein
LESAWVPKPFQITGFAMVDYSREPLRLVSTIDPSEQKVLLNQQTMLNLGVGISLWANTEISVVLPVAVSQGPRSALEISPVLGNDIPHSGIGDFRIAPKIGLFHVGIFALGFALPLSFPTARADAYLGDGRVTVTPRLLLDIGTVGGPRLIGNVGVLFRPGRDFVQVHIGNSFQYGLAAELPLAEITRLAVIASINGEKDFDYSGSEEEPLEAMAGLRWHSPVGLGVTVGAGPGLSNGYGTPHYRALLGVSWEGDTYRPHKKPVVVVVREVQVPCPPAIPPPPPPICPTCQAQQTPPPAPESLVRVSRKEIALLTPVVFATGSAELAPESFQVLDDAAQTMIDNPQLVRIRVEGHSDTQGNAARNLELSKRRAITVMGYLISKGIDAARLESAGYGGAQPLESNDTLEGRARNRRVAFVILKSTPME